MDINERKIAKPRASIHKDASAQEDLEFLKKMPSEFWTGAVKDEWIPEDFAKAYYGTSKTDIDTDELAKSKQGCLLFSKAMEAIYIDAVATMIEKQDPKYLRFKEYMKKIKQGLKDPENCLIHLYHLYDSNVHKPEFTKLDCNIMLLTICYYELYESIFLDDIPSWDTIVKTKYRNLRDKELAQYLKRFGHQLEWRFTTSDKKRKTKLAFFPCVVLLQQSCRALSLLVYNMHLTERDPAVHFRFIDGGFVDMDRLRSDDIDQYADYKALQKHDEDELHFAEKSAVVLAKFKSAGVDTAVIEKLTSSLYRHSEWYHYATEQKDCQFPKQKSVARDFEADTTLQKQETQEDKSQTEKRAQKDEQDVESVKIVVKTLGDGTPTDAAAVTNFAQAIEKEQSKVEPVQEGHTAHDPAKLKAMIALDGTYGNDHMWYLEQRSQNLDADWDKLLKLVKIQYRSCLCVEILANQVRERRGIPNIRIRINSTLESSMRQIEELLRAMKPAPKKQLGEVESDQKSECTSAEYDRADGFIESCKLQRPIMFGSRAGHGKDLAKLPIEQLILQAKVRQRRPLNFGWLNRLGMETDEKTTLVRFGVALSYHLDFADVVEIQNQLNDELRSALQADPELAVDAVLIQKIVAPDLGGLFK